MTGDLNRMESQSNLEVFGHRGVGKYKKYNKGALIRNSERNCRVGGGLNDGRKGYLEDDRKIHDLKLNCWVHNHVSVTVAQHFTST